jgi:peroxiredoxin
LGRHFDDFKELNFEVLVILGDTVEKADRYCESLHLPYPVLADPKRGVYQQYGLQRSFFIQRTASVIIDCDGIIRYIRTATNPMIWMQETVEVLKLVRTLRVTCS